LPEDAYILQRVRVTLKGLGAELAAQPRDASVARYASIKVVPSTLPVFHLDTGKSGQHSACAACRNRHACIRPRYSKRGANPSALCHNRSPIRVANSITPAFRPPPAFLSRSPPRRSCFRSVRFRTFIGSAHPRLHTCAFVLTLAIPGGLPLFPSSRAPHESRSG